MLGRWVVKTTEINPVHPVILSDLVGVLVGGCVGGF